MTRHTPARSRHTSPAARTRRWRVGGGAARPAAALALLALALLAVASACAPPPSPAAAPSPTPVAATGHPRGTLYVVGGGPQPAALVADFVARAARAAEPLGTPGPARIVVLAMASAEGQTGGEEKAADLRALGAEATNLWLDRAAADGDAAVAAIARATGVWFGGGDQNRLMAVLRGTRAAAAIRARWAAGAIVGGTSAGAAVLSRVMLTGEERRPGGDRPPGDATLDFLTIAADNVVVAEGLGLLADAVVDQHFVRRKRHNRLLSVVLDGPVRLGVGVDESTALVVGPDGGWTVAPGSASHVVVYDARPAVRTATGAPVLGAAGVRLHLLPPGAAFDPRTGTATLTPRASR